MRRIGGVVTEGVFNYPNYVAMELLIVIEGAIAKRWSFKRQRGNNIN
jgi:hypothetical protein